MLSSLVRKVFGSSNDRLIKRMSKTVDEINALEPEYTALSNDALTGKTAEFKARLADGAHLDDLLVEAFAAVREASRRVLGMRHYDVQLIGGMILHKGMIAEMRTGEGKTLVATLALYLNALTEKGAHLITVNDYLARRDAEQTGQIYQFLNMSTGIVVSGMEKEEKKAAYDCDIVYGTNNEFGFDYLRDNMAFAPEEQVLRAHTFAVVDEVDSILIDEARTPLIISGAADDHSELYLSLKDVAPQLQKRETEEGPGDYTLDEKTKQAHLTDHGHLRLEDILQEKGILPENESLYSPNNAIIMHAFSATLRAHTLFQKDVDYIVADGKVVIIDEHTGRAMAGRRWSDGLHQAIEAKEGVSIQQENQTLASITYQNFFRLYDTLSGMTGTADTEAFEFHQIYNLEVAIVPTNRPMVRTDNPDKVFLTSEEKYQAIIEDIELCVEKEQPVLVGTASIETSEYLSSLLTQKNITHEVLNAKQHEREANIIAHAGAPGHITIATNMAGRGTDIILGGSWQAEVAALDAPTEEQIEDIKNAWEKRHNAVLRSGGLHIIGSERHESRRIDNQLRGRSGRQGDPGSSRFYLSLDDPLVRIFASGRISGMMKRLGMGEGEAIESRMITRAIENAQRKVEQFHFDIRKQLLEYDNVANQQRHVIYEQRQDLLSENNVEAITDQMLGDVMRNTCDHYLPFEQMEETWDVKGLISSLKADFGLECPVDEWLEDEHTNVEDIPTKIVDIAHNTLNGKRKEYGDEIMGHLEKTILLQSLDAYWREHLANMDHLRQSINLRGYAQKDPKQEYKRESFSLFSDMLDKFRREVVATLCRVQLVREEQIDEMEDQWKHATGKLEFNHEPSETTGASAPEAKPSEPVMHNTPKVGRNEPCPCESGKKYKHCCGQIVNV